MRANFDSGALKAFVKARLLSSNGDLVEVTHEALFRVWPELAGWLNEGRELMLWRKNLQDEVEDWIAHDRSPLYLLSGARVAEGRRWLASNADDFSGPDSEFITSSIRAEDRRISRERTQQEKLRWLSRCLAVAAVVASLLGAYAFRLRNEANTNAKAALAAEATEKSQRLIAQEATRRAEAQARIATSRQLAGLSTSLLDKRLDRAILLAAEALGTENTFEARDCLFNALHAQSCISSFLHIKTGYVTSVAYSPDGKTIVAGYCDSHNGSGVVLWDVATRKPLVDEPLPVKEGEVELIAFSPDGKTIAAGFRGESRDGGVVLWDAAARKRLSDEALTVTGWHVKSFAFSPDSKTIAAVLGYSLVVWDVAKCKQLFYSRLVVNREEEVLRLRVQPQR